MQFKQQLKRDYDNNPVKPGELPDYEDLYFLYITCNLTMEEIAPYFKVKKCTIRRYIKELNISKPRSLRQETVKRTNLKRFGAINYSCTKECKDKIKNTCIEKYGVESMLQAQEIRNKIKQTNLEKYGTEVASKSQICKDKYKQTCLEKYGVESHNQLENIKEKSKNTCLEKYGVEYASQTDWFQEQVKQTCLEKYGTEYALSNRQIIEKGQQTCLQKWGTNNISTAHLDPELVKNFNNKQWLSQFINNCEVKTFTYVANKLGISYDGVKKKIYELQLQDKIDINTNSPEQELQALFPNFHKTKQVLLPLEIDLYNEELKLGIEFNGLYWHSEIFKDKNYHQNKSNLAREKDIFLYHIYEHEWIDLQKRKIILSQLNNLIHNNTNKIMARKCYIKEIDPKLTEQFLNENHLQGKDQASVRIGLFHDEKLVSIMTFCKPRFNKNYQWELSRFCNLLNYTIQGAASKLFKYFIKNYNPKSIISYSNFSKTKGNIYNILGFKFKKLASPNYIWFKGYKILSRYQCQKHKLETYQHLGNTEEEIMHARKYLKMYDAGNCVWVWDNL